jgi:hypothetical protein
VADGRKRVYPLEYVIVIFEPGIDISELIKSCSRAVGMEVYL